MIKIFNRETGEFEVVASSNASNIIVDDPSIVSGATPLSTVLTKTNAAVQELRSNVKWLYKYGGTGSGGGTGGGGTVASRSRIEVTNSNLTTSGTDKVIYLSEDSLVVRYKIFNPSNNIKFTHSVYINDSLIKSSEIINSNIVYQVNLQSLDPEVVNIVRISARDESGFNMDEYTLKIISGSVVVKSSTVPNNGTLIPMFYGAGDFVVNFEIINRIKGAPTVLEIKMNNLDDGKVLRTFDGGGIVNFTLYLMEDLNGGRSLEVGTVYTVTAQATTVLGSVSLSSDVYRFTAFLVDNNSLIVTLSDVSDNSVADDYPGIKTYLQGSDISFSYSINAASFNLFRVAFELRDSDGNVLHTIGSKYPPGQSFDPIDGHDLWTDNKIVSKNLSNNFSFSTNNLESSAVGVMYVYIYAWTSGGEIGSGIDPLSDAPINIAKFKILPSDKRVPNYTSADRRLYVDFNAPLNSSLYDDKNTYTLSTVVSENAVDVPSLVRLDLYSINKVTSGFIKNELTDRTGAMRLSGGAYGKLFVNYFNENEPTSWSMYGAGFTISLTFKSDTHPDANGTVFSYGIYDQDGMITNGIEVSLEEAKLVYNESNGIKRTISATLIQGVTTNLDFVCEKDLANGEGLMKIYLDGILTSVDVINDISTLSLGRLPNYALVGCKEVSGQLTNFCDVNIYNIRMYKSALNVPDIIKNYIISYAYLNRDDNGDFYWANITSLMARNFIDNNWDCAVWDSTSNLGLGGWKDGYDLYNSLSLNSTLPVILLSETSNSGIFRNDYYNVSFNEANARTAVNYKSSVTMEMTNVGGSKKQFSGMEMSLQGTSSMSYASKNLEIYFGDGEDGKPRLFTPKEEWLPENQFTLKADVIDSAHANNTAIGEFINNSNLFDKNYAMQFSENPYVSKVKHTLEGFPVYLFVKFGDRGAPTFLGIYNFNLGRGSAFNMGFKVLSSYTLDGSTGATQTYPSIVTSYSEMFNPYQNGVFSFEINTNTPDYISGFQQPHKTIVDSIVDQRYPSIGSTGNDVGWQRLYKLFDVLSKMYKGDPPEILTYTEDKKPIRTGTYISDSIRPDLDYFPLSWDDSIGFVNWKNANVYFTLAMAFGMVDSLGKNLTLRTWNVSLDESTQEAKGQFYTSFYDMDTALGLNNYGGQDVSPTTYIDYWYNDNVGEYTAAKRIQNASDENSKGYNMPNSRLWEVVRDLTNYDPGDIAENYQTVWSNIRKSGGALSSVDSFMDNYYNKHTKDVGEIVYNIDYSIKYLRKYQRQTDSGDVILAYNDLKFLHGNRSNYVRSWLNKRLKYIDGCMNISGFYAEGGENNRWVTQFGQDSFPDSPYVQRWNGRGNGSKLPLFDFEVTSSIPTLFCMTIGTTTHRVLLSDNKPTEFKFTGTEGESTMSWNNVRNISKFKGFSQLNFASIGLFPMSGLLDLDLSNMGSFTNTLETTFDLRDMKELRFLNLENIKAIDYRSGFIVNVSDCYKLKRINIKNSHVGSLVLPVSGPGTVGAGVLEQLQVSGSFLGEITIQNQQFLTTLDFTGCKRLQSVKLSALENIETIIFSGNSLLSTVEIVGCPRLKSVSCQGNTMLTKFTVDQSPDVETIDLLNCNNTMLQININGAYRLKTLNLSGVVTSNKPILPSYSSEITNTFYTTLTTLNLGNSKIAGFDFGSVGFGGAFTYNGLSEPILDLSHFKNLNSINLTYNSGVKYVKFNNDSLAPAVLSTSFFAGCTSLRRVFGHISFNGNSIFNGCSNFYIHEPEYIDGKTVSPSTEWRGVDTSSDGMSIWNTNTDLHTNITYNTNSLVETFAGTKVSMYDVYYVLNKADNMVDINSAFRSCFNLTTSTSDPIRRDIFAHCGNVTNASSLFIYNVGMRGPLYSVMRDVNGNVTQYNGVLSPLVSVSGGGLNNMFYACSIEYIDDYLFWQLNSSGNKLKITSLSSMFYSYSPKFVKDVNTGTEESGARASKLLVNLPNLTSLSYMFMGQKINFDSITVTGETGSATYCPLFFFNTGMTAIENSFISISATGTWENLFGGQNTLMSSFPNNFPKNMSTIRNSFIVTSTLSGSTLNYPIRNDMFTRIKSSIRFIAGTTSNLTTSTSSFSGSINKTYDPAKNNGDLFPYSVFKGCTQLVEVPAFFYNLNYTTNEVIEIPGYDTLKTNSVLFKDCTKLENLSYAFSKMNGVKFSLTSKGFISTNLKNVAYIFEGNTLNLEGKIPYGLFYMESSLTKTRQGWLANQTGFTENYGLDLDGNFISGTTEPVPPSVSISYRDIKRTITDMSYALSGLQSVDMDYYSINLGGLTSIQDSGDVLRYNEKYNTVKYVINTNFNADTEPSTIDNPFYNPNDPESPEQVSNPDYDPRYIIINPEYDPYYRVWNEWAVDGNNLDVTISASTLYNVELSLPRELPSNFYDVNNTYLPPTNQQNTKFRTMNYVVPPDIFRYCSDNGSTNVNYFMAYSNREGSYGDEAYGLMGRIPPNIFEPLTQVTNLVGLFARFIYVCPYSWHHYEGEDLVLGLMYHPDMLKPVGLRLRDVSYLFSQTTVLDKCVIPDNLFYYNLNLQHASWLFLRTNWHDTSNIQLPSNLFYRNLNISTISGMFGNSSDITSINWSRGPKIMSSSLFTSNHKNITDISYFMNGCISTTGEIPEFWTWTNLPTTKIIGAFNRLSLSKIGNLDDALASKYSSAVTNTIP